MNLLKTSAVVLLSALVLCISCKKDEDSSKLYLDGSLKITFPTYAAQGYTKSFSLDTLTTLSRDDDKPIGYYYVNPFTAVTDTLIEPDGTVRATKFSITVPYDTLGNIHLTLGAFSSDEYYGKTAGADFVVVKEGLDGKGSITGYDARTSDLKFIDSRDNRRYDAARVGSLWWMRQNLAWDGDGVAFRGYDVMSGVFGRFYTWNQAQTACPEGWRLPTEKDWNSLARAYDPEAAEGADYKGLATRIMGSLYFNGTRMWTYFKDMDIKNDSGLSVMPVGYAALATDDVFNFTALYTYAAFWTADQKDSQGLFRYLYQDRNIVYLGKADKDSFAATVRCVKDAE